MKSYDEGTSTEQAPVDFGMNSLGMSGLASESQSQSHFKQDLPHINYHVYSNIHSQTDERSL